MRPQPRERRGARRCSARRRPSRRASRGSLRRQFGCSSMVPGRFACSTHAEHVLELQHQHGRRRGARGSACTPRPAASAAARCSARLAGGAGRSRRERSPVARALGRALAPRHAQRVAAESGRARGAHSMSRPCHQPASVGRSCVDDGDQRVARVLLRRLEAAVAVALEISAAGTTARRASASACAHLVGHGAEVLADHQAAVALALERDDARAARRRG